MFRIVSPIVLTGCLILGSPISPLWAATPKQTEATSVEELFTKGWKSDQGLGTPINTTEAIRFYRQAAALGHPLARHAWPASISPATAWWKTKGSRTVIEGNLAGGLEGGGKTTPSPR